MGVDLTLLPMDRPDEFRFCLSLIALVRRKSMWSAINARKPIPLPSTLDHPLWSYMGHIEAMDGTRERGFGPTTLDSYDNALTYLSAAELAIIIEAQCEAERKEGYKPPPANMAAAAFLANLEPETSVVLYWH